MKISMTKRLFEKMQWYMELHAAASEVNYAVTDTLNNYTTVPDEIMRKKAAEAKAENDTELKEDEIILVLLIEEILYSRAGIDRIAGEYFAEKIFAESRVFDVNYFDNNPYLKNIVLSSGRQGDFELKYLEIMPYELFLYNIPKRIDGVVTIPRVALFTEKFKYPALFQHSIKSTWMSITPNEIFTMEKPIEHAKGKVLTLGCGMGYFAYMASLKDEVESVTVVEVDQQVIDLFETFLLPQFENKDKITVVKSNAVEYISAMEDGKFDYCFADIWIGIEDIESYFAVKEIGRKFHKTKFEYWIEESFASYLSSYVWFEFTQTMCKVMKIDDFPPVPDYQEDFRRKADYVHNLLKKAEITSPDHIDYYMDPKNIINLINKTKIIY